VSKRERAAVAVFFAVGVAIALADSLTGFVRRAWESDELPVGFAYDDEPFPSSLTMQRSNPSYPRSHG
jgi:hypothetical protein